MRGSDVEVLRQQLLTGWDDAYVTRGIVLVVGLFILVMTVRALCRRRIGIAPAVIWLPIGGALMIFAAIPEETLYAIIQVPYLTRIRYVVGGISLLVLLVTWEAIRQTHLQERYALLWVTTAIVLLLVAIFPQVIGFLRALTGTEYTTAVIAVAFTFLVLVAFHFSISFSSSLSRQTRLAQRIALLEMRIEELEKERSGDEPE
jgi:hypothetical protein